MKTLPITDYDEATATVRIGGQLFAFEFFLQFIGRQAEDEPITAIEVKNGTMITCHRPRGEGGANL